MSAPLTAGHALDMVDPARWLGSRTLLREDLAMGEHVSPRGGGPDDVQGAEDLLAAFHCGRWVTRQC